MCYYIGNYDAVYRSTSSWEWSLASRTATLGLLGTVFCRRLAVAGPHAAAMKSTATLTCIVIICTLCPIGFWTPLVPLADWNGGFCGPCQASTNARLRNFANDPVKYVGTTAGVVSKVCPHPVCKAAAGVVGAGQLSVRAGSIGGTHRHPPIEIHCMVWTAGLRIGAITLACWSDKWREWFDGRNCPTGLSQCASLPFHFSPG